MSNNSNSKQYDLEERSLVFAKEVRTFCKGLSRTLGNLEDSKQLIRSSGSVGANYIEANESFSKKDFLLRAKTARKEAKESRYWLQLVDAEAQKEIENKRRLLIQESTELMNILGAIIRKVSDK